jgi:hypothetical protein
MILLQNLRKMNKIVFSFLFIIFFWTTVSAQKKTPIGEWEVVSGDFRSGPNSWDTLVLEKSGIDTNETTSYYLWKSISLTKDELVWTTGSRGYNSEKNEVLSGEHSVGANVKIRKRRKHYIIRVLDSVSTILLLTPTKNGWLLSKKQ